MTASASFHPTPETQGHSRLWSVFWLQGVIPSNILWAVALWALANQRTTLLLAVFAVLLLYTGSSRRCGGLRRARVPPTWAWPHAG